MVDDAVARLSAAGIDAFGVRVDVRVAASCVEAANAVADHFGRIDFLVNNAAGNFMVSSENLSPNGLATVLGIDLQVCCLPPPPGLVVCIVLALPGSLIQR